MHINEIKEVIEGRLKGDLDRTYLYEQSYGEITGRPFLYKKQVLLADTKKQRIEGNPIWILVIENPLDLYNHTAKRVSSFLELIMVPSEVWLDGVKVREGMTINEVLGNDTLVAIFYDGYYHILEEAKKLCHND